jgi:hypothetical protein
VRYPLRACRHQTRHARDRPKLQIIERRPPLDDTSGQLEERQPRQYSVPRQTSVERGSLQIPRVPRSDLRGINAWGGLLTTILRNFIETNARDDARHCGSKF